MARVLAEKRVEMGRCSYCDHDLEVAQPKDEASDFARLRIEGHVYCSNRTCPHYAKEPHPTGFNENIGLGVK